MSKTAKMITINEINIQKAICFFLSKAAANNQSNLMMLTVKGYKIINKLI